MILFLTLCLVSCRQPAPPGVQTTESRSEPQLLDRRIAPGKGPVRGQEALLLKIYPRRLWLVGAEVTVESDPEQAEALQMLDLLNISLVYPEAHQRRFHPEKPASPVLFRLSPRQPKVTLPEGYGIPIWSNEPLQITTRWRNTSLYTKACQASSVVTLSFVFDEALQQPMKAVLPIEVFAAAPLAEAGSFNLPTRRLEDTPHGIEPEKTDSPSAPRAEKPGNPESQPSLSEPAGEETQPILPNPQPDQPTPVEATPAVAGEPERPTQPARAVIKDGHGQSFTEEWSVAPGSSQVTFLVNGQFEPSGTVVSTSGYAYPSVAGIELYRDQDLVTRFPNDSTESSFALEPQAEYLLRCQQQNQKSSAVEGLARLHLYLQLPAFKKFPDMLQ